MFDLVIILTELARLPSADGGYIVAMLVTSFMKIRHWFRKLWGDTGTPFIYLFLFMCYLFNDILRYPHHYGRNMGREMVPETSVILMNRHRW